MCMGYTKEQFEADMKADRELEMRQDAYDELAEQEHYSKLHNDCDYLFSQKEVVLFIEQLEEFKEWLDRYDITLDEIIGGM